MLTAAAQAREQSVTSAYDQWLLWVTMILLGLGLVMVYSASIAIAEANDLLGNQSRYYLYRQAAFIAVSLVAAYVAFQIPMEWWQKMAPYLFILAIFLLILVLIPGVGRSVNGSQRWLSLFVVNLQPSEFMKLIATISISILWLAGLNFKIFAALVLMLPVAIYFLIVSSPYRWERVVGTLNPWADPFGKGYQLSHALIAFGRGEWIGVGLGASVEKLLYLPEAHTDFLIAVIAEELGFVGVLTVLMLFSWLVVRAFKIGKEAVANERYFSALLAQGLGVWIGVQAIVNIGVNMGVLPTKGLTLPLLSFGGSGVLANCIAIAVLLRIDFENRRIQKGLPT